MGLEYSGCILPERQACVQADLGSQTHRSQVLVLTLKINQLDSLTISLRHSGCAAKLGWSTDFGFAPIYAGTSKTGYNIPPLVGAARASSFVKTDRCKIRPESRAKRMGSHSIPILLSKFSASQIAKACNKMNLCSPVRSEGHLDRNAEESWCHGATSSTKREETPKTTELPSTVQGDSPTSYPVWLSIKTTFKSTY